MNRRKMVYRCTLLIVVAALAVVSSSAAKEDQPPSPAQLRKDYAKINEYLEKNLATDNPELNMAKVEEMLQEKSYRCFSIGGGSMISALKMLSRFANMKSDKELCGVNGIKFMEQVDSGLVDESRINSLEYPLTRVNKIIEHYAIENALHCDFFRSPEMEYGFKQIEYDYINQYLVKSLPENFIVNDNMKKAEELLNSLSSRSGALARALEQFLELTYTLSEESCNENGHKIIVKNDKATRAQAHSWDKNSLRRIDRIFKFFVKQHEALCRSLVQKVYDQKLKELDENTYRNVLGMTSLYYLDKPYYKELAEELRQKQVDEDFTNSAIVKYAKRRTTKDDLCPKLDAIDRLNTKKVFLLVKALSTDDPDHKYLSVHLDEVAGKQYVNEEKIMRIVERYVFEPCRKWSETFEGLKKADDYSIEVTGSLYKSTPGKFMEDLAYRMRRAAYQACEYVNSSQDYILDTFKYDAKYTN